MSRRIQCFNRTFMELKLLPSLFCASQVASFNRTFMELKLNALLQRLNEPISFNRTFMELKFILKGYLLSVLVVLIVPLWN